jgi:lipoyl synthase
MTQTTSPPGCSDHEARAFQKLSRIPIKIEVSETRLPKPAWIRTKIANPEKLAEIRRTLRDNKLHTVCEEASCPNLPECFSHGTATFMIMGDTCTRRCSFCDVKHGRPNPLDVDEPHHLAETVAKMGLRYVVITSVDRDDLRDGGAQHFVDCIKAIRNKTPEVKIEVLVPDFRGRMEVALNILSQAPADVFNHNVETAPRLYLQARPGSDYQWSLHLLQSYKARFSNLPTKSGIMVGLGESNEEILQVLQDLRAHDVDMLTIGQYLQPTRFHLPVQRYVTPAEFDVFAEHAWALGFKHVASGPMVRSSYHADRQAAGEKVA